MNVIDKFIPSLIDMEEEGLQVPIIRHPDTTFIFIKYNNIYCNFIFFTFKFYLLKNLMK